MAKLITGCQQEYIMKMVSNWLELLIYKVIHQKRTLPKLTNDNNRLHVLFEGNYFKQDKTDYFHKSVVNIYIMN